MQVIQRIKNASEAVSKAVEKRIFPCTERLERAMNNNKAASKDLVNVLRDINPRTSNIKFRN